VDFLKKLFVKDPLLRLGGNKDSE